MNMKKLLIFITLLALLLACATLAVNAEEIVTEDEAVVTTAVIPDTNEGETEGEAFISEAVKTFVNEHLSEIASIATVILSTILAFLYKKGLMPIISTGFSRLVEMLNIFKGNIEDRVASFGEEAKPVIEQMNKVIDECSKMKNSFDNLQKLYEASEAEKKALEAKIARSDARDMLTCEMLYELMMCTSVPQYMKDKIATYYADTKAAIEDGEAVTSDEDIA
jgi:hypothetical protein